MLKQNLEPSVEVSKILDQVLKFHDVQERIIAVKMEYHAWGDQTVVLH